MSPDLELEIPLAIPNVDAKLRLDIEAQMYAILGRHDRIVSLVFSSPALLTVESCIIKTSAQLVRSSPKSNTSQLHPLALTLVLFN